MNEIAERRGLLEPTTFAEAIEFARMLSKSSMVPKDYQGKPENILVAVQWGREVGLGPLQALQNISVINGRPAIWGDAMLALVQASPKCEYVTETVEGEDEQMVAHCRVKRRNEPEEKHIRFGVEDAKKAHLWGKAGTWQQYPKRMLQMRARGFALRDAFADVLRGVISVEEAQDIPVDNKAKPVLHRPAGPRIDHDKFRAINETMAKVEAADARDEVAPDGMTERERGKPFDAREWKRTHPNFPVADALDELLAQPDPHTVGRDKPAVASEFRADAIIAIFDAAKTSDELWELQAQKRSEIYGCEPIDQNRIRNAYAAKRESFGKEAPSTQE